MSRRPIPTFFWEHRGREIPDVDISMYRLQVTGEVDRPMSLSLAEIEELLPTIEAPRRFYCVNGWSLAASWRGYRLAALLDVCGVHSTAQYVRAISIGGYEDTTAIKVLTEGDAMLVTHMDGEPLSLKRGKPMRLIIFNLYQFKGVKALAELHLTSEFRPGTWQSIGYTSAVIQPYPHLAIDLDEEIMPSPETLDRSKSAEEPEDLGNTTPQ